MRRQFKYQRQQYEYNILCGKREIDEILREKLCDINDKNYKKRVSGTDKLIRRIKNQCNIKNQSKTEKIWIHTINKLSK